MLNIMKKKMFTSPRVRSHITL